MSWCDLRHMSDWCEEEIIEYYDQHLDLVLEDYAKDLKISVRELKRILQDES